MGNSKVKGRKLNKDNKALINEVDDELVIKDKKIRKRKVYFDEVEEISVDEPINEVEEISVDEIDKEIENDDNMSLALIFFIVVMCFIVGIVVGYIIYRLAINTSNVLFIVGVK